MLHIRQQYPYLISILLTNFIQLVINNFQQFQFITFAEGIRTFKTYQEHIICLSLSQIPFVESQHVFCLGEDFVAGEEGVFEEGCYLEVKYGGEGFGVGEDPVMHVGGGELHCTSCCCKELLLNVRVVNFWGFHDFKI